MIESDGVESNKYMPLNITLEQKVTHDSTLNEMIQHIWKNHLTVLLCTTYTPRQRSSDICLVLCFSYASCSLIISLPSDGIAHE